MNTFGQTWSTAISTNESNGRKIVFRYISEFNPNFNRSSYPNRIILEWRYQSEAGMPVTEEHQRMDLMEDVLTPFMEKDDFSTIVLVTTGENLREWTYYAKSEDEFMIRLNNALAEQPVFPINVHIAADPEWTMYEEFKAGVRV